MRRVVSILIAIILVGLAAYVVSTKQAHAPTTTNTQPTITPTISQNPSATPWQGIDPEQPSQTREFEGEYICLPHKDTSGPQTEECAFGLKTSDNMYIALDMAGLINTSVNTKFQTGTRIKVTGLYVPIEQISTDMWQKYNLKGILKVSSATKI